MRAKAQRSSLPGRNMLQVFVRLIDLDDRIATALRRIGTLEERPNELARLREETAMPRSGEVQAHAMIDEKIRSFGRRIPPRGGGSLKRSWRVCL
jgi:hypothetical protein